MRRVAFLSVLLLPLVGCVPDRCYTPFGAGGRQFDLSLPAYSPLAGLGAMTIERDDYGLEVGHRGIYVRRISFSDFVAFDCACPNDHDVRLLPDAANDILLQCPVCGSSFETLNGNPIEGSVTSCSLYQYYTSFDGRLLQVY